MLIRRLPRWKLAYSLVTPQAHYLNRRALIAGGATALLAGGADARDRAASDTLDFVKTRYDVSDPPARYEAATGYNNFYEFGTDKSDPARYAYRMTTDPWSIEVSGHARRTGRFALEDVIDFNALEERVYRLRCVEAWSMVIPWIGVPLARVLKAFEPTGDARYVAFETYLNRSEMRGVRFPVLNWPYREGLRMDEAMNELGFVAVGLYGRVMPNQNGAPVRLVVPWKYGYKSVKSIVKISFVAEQPETSWSKASPHEYGFYSNVNPAVSHPRWSQASERIIGGGGLSAVAARRKTELFNGYGEEVAHLYAGMNLRANH